MFNITTAGEAMPFRASERITKKHKRKNWGRRHP